MRTASTIFALMLVVAMQGQTREQVISEIKRQGIPHPDIVLAQARLETGNFTSHLCRVNHNLFGIKHNGRYARYKTWHDSVADYKTSISSRYHGGDYYTFLRRIGYAKDPKYTTKLKQF